MNKDHLLSGRKEQKLNTRRKILEAAHELLKLKRPLTMDDIAKQAEISRATIYRYYSNTDSIAMELILQLNVPNGEDLTGKYKGHKLADALLGMQETFLEFVLNNEITSKKFLSAILSSSDPKLERGQNRITAIRNFFSQNEIDLNPDEKSKLTHVGVLLMGIEAILAMKDVCGLTNDQARETLRWGLEMMLKGCMAGSHKD